MGDMSISPSRHYANIQREKQNKVNQPNQQAEENKSNVNIDDKQVSRQDKDNNVNFEYKQNEKNKQMKESILKQLENSVIEKKKLSEWLNQENNMPWLNTDKKPKTLLDLLTPEKKPPSAEEIRRVIMKIRSKIRSGGRLSPKDKAFLGKYAEEELKKMVKAQREREALEVRLASCKTKEEAEEVFSSAKMAALNIDPKDPDLGSVVIGQLSAAMEDMKEKPSNLELMEEQQKEVLMRNRYDRRA